MGNVLFVFDAHTLLFALALLSGFLYKRMRWSPDSTPTTRRFSFRLPNIGVLPTRGAKTQSQNIWPWFQSSRTWDLKKGLRGWPFHLATGILTGPPNNFSANVTLCIWVKIEGHGTRSVLEHEELNLYGERKKQKCDKYWSSSKEVKYVKIFTV